MTKRSYTYNIGVCRVDHDELAAIPANTYSKGLDSIFVPWGNGTRGRFPTSGQAQEVFDYCTKTSCKRYGILPGETVTIVKYKTTHTQGAWTTEVMEEKQITI